MKKVRRPRKGEVWDAQKGVYVQEELKKPENVVVLAGGIHHMYFYVPEDFLEMLIQVAKNRGVEAPVVFSELVEQMKEELIRELD
jgi:hypothetical protein